MSCATTISFAFAPVSTPTSFSSTGLVDLVGIVAVGKDTPSTTSSLASSPVVTIADGAGKPACKKSETEKSDAHWRAAVKATLTARRIAILGGDDEDKDDDWDDTPAPKSVVSCVAAPLAKKTAVADSAVSLTDEVSSKFKSAEAETKQPAATSHFYIPPPPPLPALKTSDLVALAAVGKIPAPPPLPPVNWTPKKLAAIQPSKDIPKKPVSIAPSHAHQELMAVLMKELRCKTAKNDSVKLTINDIQSEINFTFPLPPTTPPTVSSTDFDIGKKSSGSELPVVVDVASTESETKIRDSAVNSLQNLDSPTHETKIKKTVRFNSEVIYIPRRIKDIQAAKAKTKGAKSFLKSLLLKAKKAFSKLAH